MIQKIEDGERRIPVLLKLFQFHGFLWHGHGQRKANESEVRKRPMAELQKKPRALSQKIKDKGYNLVGMWECQWH